MRFAAVLLTRWISLCGLCLGAFDLAVRAWWGSAYGLAAAAVFGVLSGWIRHATSTLNHDKGTR